MSLYNIFHLLFYDWFLRFTNRFLFTYGWYLQTEEEKKQNRVKTKAMDLSSEPQNLNPTIYERTKERHTQESDYNNDVSDEIDRREIFDLIRTISDPEHPLTLEGFTREKIIIICIFTIDFFFILELNVVDLEGVTIDNQANTVQVQFRPTIPHCSM